MDATRIERHVEVEEPVAAADCLSASSGLSKARIKRAMNQGAVWLTRGSRTQRLRRATRTLNRGDRVHLYYDARVLALEPPSPRLVADEDAYSVWFKPSGMLSQGSKWGDHCTITRWAERHLAPERPAFVVHRLDRAASGLIVVAHRKGSAAALSALFRERAVAKRYRVIVHGALEPGGDPRTIDEPLDGRDARTTWSAIAVDAGRGLTLLDVDMETGRKHQIRRHLAAAGLPVVGDRLYGEADAAGGDLQLVACRLAFRCPVTGAQRDYRALDDELPVLAGKRDAAPGTTS